MRKVFHMSKPARLTKQPESEFKFMESIEGWVLGHAHILLPLLLIILLLLIGAVIGVIVSSGNVTCTDSNLYYYHLEDNI